MSTEARVDVLSNRLSLPVSVLLERRMVRRKLWQLPSWYLHGVVVGDSMQHQSQAGQLINTSENSDVFSWSGLSVTFFKDACERYWHALIGDKPLVYVVCREELDDEEPDDDEAGLPIEPVLVSCDYDEALAHAETDQLVLSCTIPAELYRYMETFVLQHYQPKPFEKRKRKRWQSEDPAAQPRAFESAIGAPGSGRRKH